MRALLVVIVGDGRNGKAGSVCVGWRDHQGVGRSIWQVTDT